MSNDTFCVKYLGNYFGFTGKSYDGWVVDDECLAYTLLESCQHGSVPKIIRYELESYGYNKAF